MLPSYSSGHRLEGILCLREEMQRRYLAPTATITLDTKRRGSLRIMYIQRLFPRDLTEGFRLRMDDLDG
jgi:hypothetical protein